MTKNEWYSVNGVDVRRLQTHGSVEELNITVNYAVQAYFADMTKSTVQVLRHIAQYAVKSVGVAWRGNEGIAAALGINERTVRRALATLDKLNVIKRLKTRKWNGDRGVDIVMIQKATGCPAISACDDETSTETERECHVVGTEMSGESIKALKTTKTNKENKRDDNEYTRNTPSLSIEEIFAKEAEAAGLPTELHTKILERINRYAAGIGAVVPYIRAAIQKAVNTARNYATKRTWDNGATVHNNAGQVRYNAQNTCATERNGNAATTFEQATKAQVSRKKPNMKITAAPQEIINSATQAKAEWERQQAEKKAQEKAEPYEEKLARIKAMLGM